MTCVGQGGHTQSAFIGVWSFDGNGRLAGSTIINQPSRTFKERVVVNATIEGTYIVDENGSGYGSMAATWAPEVGSPQSITATLFDHKSRANG